MGSKIDKMYMGAQWKKMWQFFPFIYTSKFWYYENDNVVLMSIPCEKFGIFNLLNIALSFSLLYSLELRVLASHKVKLKKLNSVFISYKESKIYFHVFIVLLLCILYKLINIHVVKIKLSKIKIPSLQWHFITFVSISQCIVFF